MDATYRVPVSPQTVKMLQDLPSMRGKQTNPSPMIGGSVEVSVPVEVVKKALDIGIETMLGAGDLPLEER